MFNSFIFSQLYLLYPVITLSAKAVLQLLPCTLAIFFVYYCYIHNFLGCFACDLVRTQIREGQEGRVEKSVVYNVSGVKRHGDKMLCHVLLRYGMTQTWLPLESLPNFQPRTGSLFFFFSSMKLEQVGIC